MTEKQMALVLFCTAYILFVFLPKRRSLVAIVIAALTIPFGCLGWSEMFWAVNWNVMGIFVGTLVLAEAFIDSRAPAYFAEVIVNRAPNTTWALLSICMLTSFLSAFIENVATVLIVAPIALSLAKKLNVNPVNMMIGIAICSNLQGTATLIGDPPSMLLGGFAKMTFMDFFFYRGRPSIFFAVEIGAIFSFAVLYWLFRRHKERIELVAVEEVRSWFPTWLLISLVVALALSSFLDQGFSYLAGIICMVCGAIALVWHKWINKGNVLATIKSLDWDTTAFLVGIFVIVGSLTTNGWTDEMATGLSHWVGSNLFVAFTLMVFISVVISAFVDNVPYLAAMLPVAITLAQKLNVEPSLLLFGLLIGASLGGNVTPIGASANIVATGLLSKEGHTVSFGHWLKISIPFTIAAVTPAYLLVWFIWS